MITPIVLYEDVARAMQFLSSAFGFHETLRYDDPAGFVSHAEMRRGDSMIMLGDPGDTYRNPARTGVTVHLHLAVDNVDDVYQTAIAAGASTSSPPTDQPYGERSFTATDPEGHIWTIAQPLAPVDPTAWGATSIDE